MVTGDLRDDVLLAGSESTRRADARARLDEAIRICRRQPASCCTRRPGATAAPTRRSHRCGVGRDRRVARATRRGAAGPHPPARPRRLRRRPGAIGPHPAAGPDLLARRQPGPVGGRRAGHRLLLDRLRLRAGRRPVVFFAPDLASYATTRGYYLPSRVQRRPARHQLGRCAGPARRGAQRGSGRNRPPPRAAPARGVLRRARRAGRRARARRDPGAHRTTRRRRHATSRSRPADGHSALVDSDSATLTIDGLEGEAALVGRRATVEADAGVVPAARHALGLRPACAAERHLPARGRRPLVAGGRRCSTPEIRHELFHATVREHAGGLVVEIEPPLDDDERGAAAQSRSRRPTELPPRGRGRRVPRELLRTVGVLQPARHRPCPGRGAPADSPVLERRRRLGRDPRGRGPARRGQPRVVARPRLRPRAHRQRLAAQALPQASRPARAADLARHDAQAARPRPPGRRPAHQDRVRRERRRWDALLAQNEYSAELFPRPTPSAARSGWRATRATTCSPGPCWHRVSAVASGSTTRPASCSTPPPGATTAPRWSTTSTWRRSPSPRARPRAPGARPLPHAAHGHDLAATGLIDVTSYPDMTDLLLVADVLVTDYSSVMFDFVPPGGRSSSSRPTCRLQRRPARLLLRPARRGARSGRRDRRRPGRRHPRRRGTARRARRRHPRLAERFTPHDDGQAGARGAADDRRRLALSPATSRLS